MKVIIYNHSDLKESDITEIVVRIKVLLINDNKMLLGKSNDIYQFPGGHLEDGETLIDCLKREVLEETGIKIDDREIDKPFMKLSHMNKDYPEVGKNRKSEIYYYIVNTNKNFDVSKTNYTEEEKLGNFKLELVPLDSVIDVIKNNNPDNERNKIIAKEMISAITEYFKQREE